MSPLHILLAILTVAVWGLNFVFIKIGLNELPPLFLCTLRFVFVSIPIVFILPKPSVPFKHILQYGLVTFALQFSFLFLGMHAGMPAGLSSIVLQVQVFFSLFLAAFFLKERLGKLQILGSIVSFTGLGVIWTKVSHDTSWLGFILEIGCAASLAVSNLITKKIGPVNPLSLVGWGSLVAIPPLLLLSLVVEGPAQITVSLHHITWLSILSVAYTAYISTWFGYGVWSWLIGKYPVSSIIPFTLLVPIFGMLGSNLVFQEPMQQWKLQATLFIILGLSIHIFGPKILSVYQRRVNKPLIAS